MAVQTRMGTSTNFIDAFDAAAKQMRELSPEVARVVLLGSDFRVDDYSGAPPPPQITV